MKISISKAFNVSDSILFGTKSLYLMKKNETFRRSPLRRYNKKKKQKHTEKTERNEKKKHIKLIYTERNHVCKRTL